VTDAVAKLASSATLAASQYNGGTDIALIVGLIVGLIAVGAAVGVTVWAVKRKKTKGANASPIQASL
jgi:hypothetical protein